MTSRIFVPGLLLFVLASPGCKGAVKAAAKVARHAERAESGSERESRADREAAETEAEFERKLARLEQRNAGKGAAEADPAAEAARTEEDRIAHLREAEEAWTAYRARRVEDLDAPERRLRAVVEHDAKLPAKARLPPLRVGEWRQALAIDSIGRGDPIGAMSLLLKAAVDADADSTVYDNPSERAKSSARNALEIDAIHRGGENLLHAMGRFPMALERLGLRLAADKAGERSTPQDLARFEEFSALVGASPPRLDDAALARLQPDPESLAVASAYRAIAHLTSNARGPALEELDRADGAARAVTTVVWQHQTVGTAFTTDSAGARCASRFHAAVRGATYPAASAAYLVGPLVGLRLCVLGMAEKAG